MIFKCALLSVYIIQLLLLIYKKEEGKRRKRGKKRIFATKSVPNRQCDENSSLERAAVFVHRPIFRSTSSSGLSRIAQGQDVCGSCCMFYCLFNKVTLYIYLLFIFCVYYYFKFFIVLILE